MIFILNRSFNNIVLISFRGEKGKSYIDIKWRRYHGGPRGIITDTRVQSHTMHSKVFDVVAIIFNSRI